MIRLDGRLLLEYAPEAGDPVERLPAEHALRSQVDGGEGGELEEEQIRVFGLARQGAEVQEIGHPLGGGTWGLDQGPEGPKQLAERRARSVRSLTRSNWARARSALP